MSPDSLLLLAGLIVRAATPVRHICGYGDLEARFVAIEAPSDLHKEENEGASLLLFQDRHCLYRSVVPGIDVYRVWAFNEKQFGIFLVFLPGGDPANPNNLYDPDKVRC